MAKCLNPTRAWLCGSRVSRDGVLSPHLVFSERDALDYFSRIGCLHLMDKNILDVPCGKCVNCQMRKRKDMSVRLAHEASCFENACFLTLTYDNKNVPVTDWNALKYCRKQFDRGIGELPEMTLCPRDVQLFIKRLRRYLEYHHGIKGLRYFAVGEYGTKTHRPHYHVILFGWCPSDLELLKMHKGNPVYISELVRKRWKYGHISVSKVNTAVAKYCARYVTKKFSRLADAVCDYVVPEFTLQSVRNGGIGSTWFDKYGVDACRLGFATLRTGPDRISKVTIPRYYWSRLRKRHLEVWLHCRDERIAFVKSRLCVAETYDDLFRAASFAVEQIRREADDEVF